METTLEKIKEIYTGEDKEMLVKAYEYTKEAHANQKRASGEPYFIHPCAVADILMELGLDAATIAAALLHDVIEDTSSTAEDIKREFGDEVLNLVAGVTKLEKIVFKSKEDENAENFRKIFVAMAKDVRVIIIKLADRLHNMRSLNFLSFERQQRMASETLDIYAPLAGRLGISQIKCELEDLCLKYLDPESYEYLVYNISERLSERKEFVNGIVAEIKELMRGDGVPGEVFGRPKHFYSIYKKMKNKGKTLDQIYDLTAVRVIVKDIGQCYTVLGRIHEKWKPIPGRIKDYIATPKPNKYQSLHTTVMTRYGQPFEIQIRTEEMHRIAEFGIAAHWKYKEGKTEEAATNFENRLTWLREVMEWQGDLKDSKEFISALKTELYSHELLVFTPRGKVISLPPEATPVDFAYAIHSEVGNHCTGARVNSKIVPLTTTLEVGDVVEIITSPNSKGPSRDWLKFIKSSSAKAKIKQFYRNELKEENIRIGQIKLEDEAKKKGFTLSTLLTDESFKRISERFSFGEQDEMFAAVGYGSISVNQILFKLIDYYRKETPMAFEVHAGDGGGRTPGGVLVNGQAGMLVRFAGCCSPVPGDRIVGYTSRGRGVVIHRHDCPNVKGVEQLRLLPAEWQVAAGAKQRYNANIAIRATDQGAALSVLSFVVSEMKLSITAVNGRIDKNRDAILEASISLTDISEVDQLIKRMEGDRRIYEVHRIT
ncbi:MAG: bifunctional (p)ppGpp synthetase/guanosine-3',5'-bis(diphosphate) 3'-pyrophosphohydrolase [Clostridiales bacterium]|nr:bifunctional (p)ppGpp synthetase/guanosine-3',5'-bis(diphosphate) 3'-pyrophosphohydrolase [Clostridiales bacterium]MBQ2768571.1 bifunctional (p)ppGpp synthetase/guanosine-3',5'-bis(diphosphate) 3'-pyrophosphohydrolase [Clostridia bacterium]